ncbi:MAG: hypothetical protein ABIF40_00580 [archaeon]
MRLETYTAKRPSTLKKHLITLSLGIAMGLVIGLTGGYFLNDKIKTPNEEIFSEKHSNNKFTSKDYEVCADILEDLTSIGNFPNVDYSNTSGNIDYNLFSDIPFHQTFKFSLDLTERSNLISVDEKQDKILYNGNMYEFQREYFNATEYEDSLTIYSFNDANINQANIHIMYDYNQDNYIDFFDSTLFGKIIYNNTTHTINYNPHYIRLSESQEILDYFSERFKTFKKEMNVEEAIRIERKNQFVEILDPRTGL